MTAKEKLIEVMNQKEIRSRISWELIEFVNELKKEHFEQDDKCYSDGITLIDNIENIEDDIQQMTGILTNGEAVNMEDFFQENGAFNNGENFLEALKTKLRDRKEKTKFEKAEELVNFWNDFLDELKIKTDALGYDNEIRDILTSWNEHTLNNIIRINKGGE